MHAVVLLGAVIVVALVAADWIAFTRKSPRVLGYGLAVGRQQEALRVSAEDFDTSGCLPLPHGMAWLCPEQHAIILLPEWKRFGLRFRTAWPLNGALHYDSFSDGAEIRFIKRMPWSSALLTALWFLTVAGGLLAYLVSYAQAGGFSSAPGAFLGAAWGALESRVLLFGIIGVVAA